MAIKKDSGSDDSESMIVNSEPSNANDFSTGVIQVLYTGLSAGTYTFKGRWRLHYASGSWNNSLTMGWICLWELG